MRRYNYLLALLSIAILIFMVFFLMGSANTQMENKPFVDRNLLSRFRNRSNSVEKLFPWIDWIYASVSIGKSTRLPICIPLPCFISSERIVISR